jgi:hypothetical protein
LSFSGFVVTGTVTIPNYPSEKGKPTITVDDPSKLPDGNTPGTSNVDVTVTLHLLLLVHKHCCLLEYQLQMNLLQRLYHL